MDQIKQDKSIGKSCWKRLAVIMQIFKSWQSNCINAGVMTLH